MLFRSELDEVVLYPARELLIDDSIVARAETLAVKEPWGQEQWERIAQRSGFDGMENWLAWLVDKETTLIDVLPERSGLVVCDPAYLRSRARELQREEREVADALASTWSFEVSEDLPRLHVDIDALLEDSPAEVLLSVASPGLGDPSDGALNVVAGRWGSPATSNEQLAERLREYLQLDYRVVIACDSVDSATRIRNDMSALAVPSVLHTATGTAFDQGAVHFVVRALHEGFALPDARVLVATESEISGRRNTRRRRARRRRAVTMFEDLKAGDHVVHDVHGIGVFEGMARRKLDGVERDFLQLR